MEKIKISDENPSSDNSNNLKILIQRYLIPFLKSKMIKYISKNINYISFLHFF